MSAAGVAVAATERWSVITIGRRFKHPGIVAPLTQMLAPHTMPTGVRAVHRGGGQVSQLALLLAPTMQQGLHVVAMLLLVVVSVLGP